MLAVYKMPLKNQFQSRISSGYDKTPKQNKLKPFTSISFTGNCTFDFLGKESCHGVTDTLNRTGILYKTSIKPDAEMLLCDGDFDPIRFDFEIETAKSDIFMVIFTSYGAL